MMLSVMNVGVIVFEVWLVNVLSSLLDSGVVISVLLLKFMIVRLVVIFGWFGNYLISVEMGEM